ncbi:hypothetical protein J1TS3_16610 [Siminovitchia fordii]|uniref:Uncharacterized protein n=1 Tax=Siminovitchia fordii TaxID=254759 RepID=A0ABQ4K460_9BACI|nr:hypothetical protein J1TS3_16610 [Siminovitchia fordii]
MQEKSVASTVTSLCGVCATYSFMYCEEEKFLYDVGRMQIFKPEPQFDYENGICVIYLTENFFNYIVAKKYVEKLKSEMKSSVINKEVISENSAKNTREGWKSTLLRRIKGRKLF